MPFFFSNIFIHYFSHTGNNFFHRVTGLSQEDVKRITIFSLVKANNLSNLYELVAESLREGKNEPDPNSVSPSLSSSNDDSKNTADSYVHNKYETITLPCIKFPKELPIKSDGSRQEFLFMHVSKPIAVHDIIYIIS
jgi:hypothetical protein